MKTIFRHKGFRVTDDRKKDPIDVLTFEEALGLVFAGAVGSGHAEVKCEQQGNSMNWDVYVYRTMPVRHVDHIYRITAI